MKQRRGLIEAPLTRHAYIGVETYVPLRASFGGMDVVSFIMNDGRGFLFSTGLNMHAIVRVLPEISQRKNVVKAAVRDEQGELVLGEQHVVDVREIRHPYVRAAMLFHGMNNLQIDLQASVSARLGLGGSSAMMTALLIALWHWKHQGRIAINPVDLVRDVSFLELGPPANGYSLGETHGVQDTVGCLGLNLTGSPVVAMPIIRDTTIVNGSTWAWTRPDYASAIGFGSSVQGWLDERLLFFMIKPRQQDAAERLATHKPTRVQLQRLTISAERAAVALSAEQYETFVGQVRESWDLKQELDPNVVPVEAQPFYHQAIEIGAHFVRVVGAGGGGFYLVLAERQLHQALIEASYHSDVVWYCETAAMAETGAGVQNFKPSRS